MLEVTSAALRGSITFNTEPVEKEQMSSYHLNFVTSGFQ